MNIVIIEPRELNGAEARLVDERFVHIRKVLRKQPGDRVRVGQLNGPLGQAEVLTLDGESVHLRCVWEESGEVAAPQIDLLLAMPRPKVMRRLWAQLAALGVARILVTNAEKVERYYFDSKALDPSLIREALIEGLQQCGHTALPEVTVHRFLKPLVEDQLDGVTDKRVAVPGAGRGLHAESESERVLLAIGPEGGWSSFEMDLFAANGFVAVGLGDRILRSDTACIAAVALLRDALFKP